MKVIQILEVFLTLIKLAAMKKVTLLSRISKTLLLCLLIPFLFVGNSKGQTENPYRYNIGINAFSYVSNNAYFPEKYDFSLPAGLMFKIENDHFSSRFALTYSRSRYEEKLLFYDGYEGFHYHSIFSGSFGIQKDVNFNKFGLFAGMDLFVDNTFHKLDLHGGFDGQELHDRSYVMSLGIGPLVGIKYKISDRLTIAAETRYNLAYPVINEPHTNKFLHYLNPLSALTIFYSFN